MKTKTASVSLTTIISASDTEWALIKYLLNERNKNTHRSGCVDIYSSILLVAKKLGLKRMPISEGLVGSHTVVAKQLGVGVNGMTLASVCLGIDPYIYIKCIMNGLWKGI